MTLFEGAGVALVTPFKENGEVNYEKLEEIVEEQIAGGTDAIIACGTTGEASTMTHEEHLEVIEYICRVTKNGFLWLRGPAQTVRRQPSISPRRQRREGRTDFFWCHHIIIRLPRRDLWPILRLLRTR